jgi:hypothetical protein
MGLNPFRALLEPLWAIQVELSRIADSLEGRTGSGVGFRTGYREEGKEDASFVCFVDEEADAREEAKRGFLRERGLIPHKGDVIGDD